MERIVAMVEGHTEAHFVTLSYGNAIVQRPFPNGKTVSLRLIVESIIDAIDTIGPEIQHVVIILDREKRDITAAEMSSYILREVSAYANNKSIHVGVADRQIENWILADELYIRQKFVDQTFSYDGDGTPAKFRLEQMCGSKMKGPRDKALMLKSTSVKRSVMQSPSLQAFIDQINFNWYWALN